MKPVNAWSCDRYRPALHGGDDIYICQVIPAPDSVALSWRSPCSGEHTVFCREKGSKEPCRRVPASRPGSAVITGLRSDTDYLIDVRCGDAYSVQVCARTGAAPGTVVNYLHPDDARYAFSGRHLCTPSLLQHPEGYLLASMDVFEGRAPQNLTLIFRSDDQGQSWYHYTELFPCFWGKLFLHRGAVYMLATSTEYGDLLIGRSADGGKTFSMPTVLLRGSGHWQTPGWHKSAMPVIEHRGRLWTGLDYGAHAVGGHASLLLSADADANLTDAGSWRISEPLCYDPSWPGSVSGDSRGFLEGNAVVLPDGEIGNVLRYSTNMGRPTHGRIPILRGNSAEPEQALSFEKYVPFPGNLSKFDILFDPVSRYYYSIVNRIYNAQNPGARNLLSLVRSPDLESWETVTDLLDATGEDPRFVAFQYVSFLFSGEDLLYLCRTAVNGAQSYHDNNYITFHRLRNFRTVIP